MRRLFQMSSTERSFAPAVPTWFGVGKEEACGAQAKRQERPLRKRWGQDPSAREVKAELHLVVYVPHLHPAWVPLVMQGAVPEQDLASLELLTDEE